MEKLSVKQKIADVLMKNDNGFLSIEELAELCYEGAYLKETKKHLNGLIKRNISHAIAMLTEEGFLVIKDLIQCTKGQKLSYKGVNGYKIADKGDEHDISINLKSKSERLYIAQQIKINYHSLINDNKLLIENN